MIKLSKYQMQDAELVKIAGEDLQFQCRQIGDTDVKVMVETLEKEKQKVPIYLLRRRNGKLVILCGFTRYLAAKQLGWVTIVAIIIPEEDFENENEIYKFVIVENGKRKPLSNVDKGNICKNLSSRGISNVEIGEWIGKSENQVRRYLKVANAPADIQQKVETGEITIKEAGNEKLAPGGEQIVDNPSCYVKTTKSGFKAALNYRASKDNIEVVKSFKAKIDAELDKLQKAQEDADKTKAQEAAEADKQANEAKITKLGEAIKDLEIALKVEEQQGLDTTKIKQLIKARKAELKALLKPARKGGGNARPVSSPPAGEDAQRAGEGERKLPDTAKTISDKAQKEQLQNLKDQIVAAGGDAMALFTIPQLEALTIAIEQQLSMPGLSDEQRAKLNERLQKAREQLALKKSQPASTTGGDRLDTMSAEEIESAIAEIKKQKDEPGRSESEKVGFQIMIDRAQARLDALRSNHNTQPPQAGDGKPSDGPDAPKA